MHDTNLSFFSGFNKKLPIVYVKNFLTCVLFAVYTHKKILTFFMVKKEQEPEIYEQYDEYMYTHTYIHACAHTHTINSKTTLQILVISARGTIDDFYFLLYLPCIFQYIYNKNNLVL